MMPTDSAAEFDAIAKWYDFDYDRRMRKDLPFYLRCACEGGNPVLELGAGTGRVTAYLAKRGFAVTGVELSERMLERARERIARLPASAESVRLVQGDMADFRLRGAFGTVLVPFRSFHHLYTIDRQLSALRAIRRSLAPSGTAVIDLFNPDLEELHDSNGKLLLSYERKHPKRGTKIVQRFRITCDFDRQIGWLDYYWEEYRGKRKIGTDHAPMRWRWFHRYEFEHLLARAGLRVVRVYGDFDGNPWEHDSEEMIFLTVRA
jgi:SAM-dependent methyltransferase